jgi:hypothetical protein
MVSCIEYDYLVTEEVKFKEKAETWEAEWRLRRENKWKGAKISIKINDKNPITIFIPLHLYTGRIFY